MLRVGFINNKISQYFVITLFNHIDMKKVIYLLMSVLTSSISLGQTKKNNF
jgi:hypothetical protein